MFFSFLILKGLNDDIFAVLRASLARARGALAMERERNARQKRQAEDAADAAKILARVLRSRVAAVSAERKLLQLELATTRDAALLADAVRVRSVAEARADVALANVSTAPQVSSVESEAKAEVVRCRIDPQNDGLRLHSGCLDSVLSHARVSIAKVGTDTPP